MLVLSNEDIDQLLTMPECIEVLDKPKAAGLGHVLPDDWFSETVHP